MFGLADGEGAPDGVCLFARLGTKSLLTLELTYTIINLISVEDSVYSHPFHPRLSPHRRFLVLRTPSRVPYDFDPPHAGFTLEQG